MVNKISVVIITLNEEANIADCILSCKGICNEVIVIDSFSADNTVAIAENMGAKVFQKNWSGYGTAKNKGTELCQNEWILSIDADERLDANIRNYLLNVPLKENEIYSFKRNNYIGKNHIRFGEWNPDIKIRLYQKNQAKWSEELVHEKLNFSATIKKVTLPGSLLHFSYKNIEDLENKLSNYAELSAKELYNKGISYNHIKYYSKPIFRFIKSYLLKLGFLDGTLGYEIAIANSKAVKKRYQYLKEMLNNDK